MKVVHVVRQFFPSIGGMENVVMNLASRNKEYFGVSADVITLNRVFSSGHICLPEREMVNEIHIKRIPYFGSNRYPIAPKIISMLSNYDLIHVHGVDFFYDFLPLVNFVLRKKIVASTHGGFFHTDKYKLIKDLYFSTMTRFSSNGYHAVVATSHSDGEIFTKVCGKKLHVIENGVDIEKYKGVSKATGKKIIYFGRWSSNKKIEDSIYLIKLLNELDGEGEPWEIIIAGRPYDFGADELKKNATKFGVIDRCRFIESPTEEELRGLIEESRYYVCHSAHEGFGLAPIEAMSAGLIPLLSDIPPFARLVENTGFGILCNGQISEQAKSIIKNHEKIKDVFALKNEISNSVVNYSWNGASEKYFKLYESIFN